MMNETKETVNQEVNENKSDLSTQPQEADSIAELRSQLQGYQKAIDELKDMINLKFDDLMSARGQEEVVDRPDDPEMVTLDELDDDELPVW